MPDNAIYFQVAYASVVVILGGYIVSLWSRSRAVRARLLAERERGAR